MRVLRRAAELWRSRESRPPHVRVLVDATATFVLGVLLLAVGVVGLWTDAPAHGSGGGSWVHLGPLLAGCLTMLGKRRRPVLALVGGLVVFAVDLWFGGSVGVVVVLIDLIYSAARFAGARGAARLRIAVVATVAIGSVAAYAVSADLQVTVFFALQLFALLVAPLWWGLDVRRQSELTALATARADDLRRLAALREAEVVGAERARMARDLHDAIAGNLSAIAIHAEAALSVPAADPSARTRDRMALEAIRAAGVASLREMRSMIVLLRNDSPGPPDRGLGPDDLAAPPRLPQAGELVSVARAAGLDVVWPDASVAALPDLPAVVDQAAYRILQEALTNAAKHAAGSQVRIAVGADDGTLALRVDTVPTVGAAGSPTDRPQLIGSGLGLLTMRERVEVLGGRLTAGWDQDAAQWSVVAELPLEADAR